MKRIVGWVALGLLLAGCVVPSVYPFYTEKDLKFDPALVGTWRNASGGSNDKESFVFEKNGENAYTLTYTTDSLTNVMAAHLFKLDGQLFMDWLLISPCGTDGSLMTIPSHYVFKVRQIQPLLELSTLSVDWVNSFVTKNPDAIRHTMALDKPGSTELHVVLTADTKELQKFILEHADDTNAFADLGDLKRDEVK